MNPAYLVTSEGMFTRNPAASFRLEDAPPTPKRMRLRYVRLVPNRRGTGLRVRFVGSRRHKARTRALLRLLVES